MFKDIRTQMQAKFNEIVATGKLFTVDANRDEVWQTYLNAFSEDKKQENTCNCCKSFIRQYGSIVGINNKNEKITLWDFIVTDEEYLEPIKALSKYIKSLPITGIFFAEQKKCGVEKNPDNVRGIIWDHYAIEMPPTFVKKDSGPLQATALDSKNVLKRSLEEISDDAVDTVLELIAQGSLYRGEEHKKTVLDFRALKNKYKLLKNTQHKDNFCWLESTKAGGNVTRIRNTSIGTLLNDLSEGKELDKAVTAFERVVAPTNYKRPTALVTPRMISDAQKTLEELGLTGALYRRMLSTNDLNVNNSLFVYRPKKKEANIFDELKKAAPPNLKSLDKVDEVSIGDFVEKILPTCKSVKILVDNTHIGNFASLVGPKNPDDPTLFKYGNNYSWSYTGGVADSMRTRVTELGGRVDGVLRFTHSWNHPEVGRNASLMDLHVFMPGSSAHKDGCHDHYPSGQRVGWNQRTDHISGGRQDVDYTNAAPEGHIPLENITFPDMKKLKDGKYTFKIHNWTHRAPTASGFKAEIEFGGQIFSYNHPSPLKNKEWVTLAEATLKNGVFTIEHKFESQSSSQKKWGIDTERFHNVKAICLSPNHWSEKPVGNKHYMFLLDDCIADEAVRPFYNENLKEEFSKHRKVFELLASKIKVESVENELSGVGFSDTIRNEVVAQIEGAFKRTIKIKF